MKKVCLLLLMLWFGVSTAQSGSFQEARTSNDPRVVATFIKANPSHPQVVELKQHLINLVNSGAVPMTATSGNATSPTYSGGNSSSYSSAGGQAAHKKKTVDLLNHLFNNDPSSKDAYIQITNNSACNIMVNIVGPRSYSLNIPSRRQNFVLVDKGTYNLSSKICGASYASRKVINKDITITLNK